jgi:hypothetical protein
MLLDSHLCVVRQRNWTMGCHVFRQVAVSEHHMGFASGYTLAGLDIKVLPLCMQGCLLAASCQNVVHTILRW